MKKISHVIFTVVLIASFLLSSCSGGVKGPDAINWTDAEDPATFQNFENPGNRSDLNTISEEDKSTFENEFNISEEQIPEIDCDTDESKANECVGNNQFGFDQVDGVSFCYVDGECYRFSETATNTEKEATLQTFNDITELEKKMFEDGGEAAIAYAFLLIAAIEAGMISGCTVVAALTLGGSCAVAIVGAGIASIAFIWKYRSLTNDILKSYDDKNYLEEKVKNGTLIPCRGN